MDQRTNPKLIFQKMEHRIDSSDLEGVREKMKTMVEVRKKAVTEGVDCIIPMSSTRNVRNFHEAWFANEDAVCKPVGMLDNTNIKPPKDGEES